MAYVKRWVEKILGKDAERTNAPSVAGNRAEIGKPKIILPLYAYEPGIDLLTHAANEGIPTSSTKSEARVREGKGNIQIPVVSAGARASAQSNISQESLHSPAVMLSDTRQKLAEQQRLKIDPSFAEVSEGDLVEVAGCVAGADVSTQTQGLMQAALLASQILTTIPGNQKRKMNNAGLSLEHMQAMLEKLSKSKDDNPGGHLILKCRKGYMVRVDTDRNCFLRPINEHYAVSTIGMVKRKIESGDPPLSLMAENVKPLQPLIEQLEQKWGNVFEGQSLLKELEGPCLIVIPICIH